MANIKPISIQKFDGWLNTGQPTSIKDNQFSILNNFYYNSEWQVETRRGYTTFADALADPITSYFFYQNDWTGTKKAVCNAGTKFYELNNTTVAWVEKKSWLTAFETATGKTTWRTRRDYVVYKDVIYMCDWINNYASWNWSTYTEYASEPKVRYLAYASNTIFGGWADAAMHTLYYTATTPADATNLDANNIVVGRYDLWGINGLAELGAIVLCWKANKIYSVDFATPKVTPIDSQSGMYCNRSIANISNALVYYTDKAIDNLKQRDATTGSTALESLPLSKDVSTLLDQIEEVQYNSGTSYYDKALNNYYFTFDTNNDNVPDTTLVYSSLVWSWSKYSSFPVIYDYGRYIDSNNEVYTLFASGSQMYRMEYGLTDNGAEIEYELETKRRDMNEPWLVKNFDYIDIVWLKNVWAEITVKVKLEWDEISIGTITDDNIDITSTVKTLWLTPIWSNTMWSNTQSEGIDMYRYSIRIPCYGSGSDISVNMSSTGWVWTLEKMRVSVEKEVIEVYNYWNIL